MPSEYGGWDIKHPGDLKDVKLPENAGRSREIENPLGANDQQAQHKAATILGYQLHGSRCTTCANATGEHELCAVGRQLYQAMRDAGAVE